MDKSEYYYVWNTWTQMNDLQAEGYGVISSAAGMEFKNENNRRFLDGLSSMFNCNIGYGNEKVKSALMEQVDELSGGANHWEVQKPARDLAKKLCDLTGGHYKHVFFTNSGSESNETALKMVRQYFSNQDIPRRKILSLDGCYHGATYGTMSMYLDHDDDLFGLMLEDFIKVPTYISEGTRIEEDHKEKVAEALDTMESTILAAGADKIAALFYEPIQLSNKVNIFPDEYLEGLYKLSRKYGFLMVADEVATGFGRCGEMFQSQRHSFHPDIITLAKGISSGYVPLGAVMATDAIFNEFLSQKGDSKDRTFAHGFTTSGNPLACRCAMEVINIIERDGLVANSKKMGEILLAKLIRLAERYECVYFVQGRGLLVNITLNMKYFEETNIEKPAFFLRGLLKSKGIMVYVEADFNDSVLLAPPLIVNSELIDRIITIMDSCFKKIKDAKEMKNDGKRTINW